MSDKKMGHTPGPWRSTHAEDVWCPPEIIGPDGRHVAIVREAYRTGDEFRANALLIASAPAMLEALETLDAALNLDALANRFPEAEEAVDKVKAAIKLSKGRY